MHEPDAARFVDAIAGELDATRQLLEALALQLCEDPVVFARQAGPLQAFDRVGQVLGEMAAALRHAGPPEAAIHAIGVDTIRDRLARSCMA